MGEKHAKKGGGGVRNIPKRVGRVRNMLKGGGGGGGAGEKNADRGWEGGL